MRYASLLEIQMQHLWHVCWLPIYLCTEHREALVWFFLVFSRYDKHKEEVKL